jgi:sugar phosphate isomerase/epimerase
MRLSVQLYTLRDPLAADFEGTLDAVRDAGIPYVELAGLGDKSPAEFKAALDARGLKASGAHIGIEAIEDDFDGVVEQAKTIGFDLVIVPYVGKDKYEAGWAKFAERMAAAGAKLSGAGLRLLYHNHDFEFAPDGDKPGLDVFYEAAPAEAFGAELDLAWVQIGGGDPVTYIKKLGSRAEALHFKDYDPTQSPQWVPAGSGKVDLKACAEAGKAAGAKFAVIELDQSPGDPVESVTQSAAYLKGLGIE